MIGPPSGPNVVPWQIDQYLLPHRKIPGHLPYYLTDMKVIIARPLTCGLKNISAYKPPMTVKGTEAQVPQIRRKMSSDGQLGARAEASVNKMKTLNVQNVTGFRPMLSLRGLNTKGPKM